MKKRLLTILLVAAIILTVLIPTCALADANASGAVTIDGTLTAGTLHSRVQALSGINSPMDVTSLTITATGSLDPADIAYINAMTNLTRLDVDTTITCTDAGDNFLVSFKNLTL